MRGSVRVSSLADPQQQVVLKPHEKVQLSGGQLSLRTSDDPNEYLWPMAYFGERPQFADTLTGSNTVTACVSM